ncbi:hypothetical protein CH333_09035 [candidate division WOR-3 bacterium JGI_Cruoil_03_44_89]|uniref:NFACT protein RNA binding domain-containing protein n=1 Tax=candidate division WOR-3 bacterium JGI_Cruoil_03_44_89 TaxID=1973748 RepID=A0A235BQV1_UNCW3|nr:MAG: hypothetical protein CH333_09035 [candidate division WOR-3 bacterium JGI_Cruoil_03_44_89]
MRAVSLFSGGLDSILSVKLVQLQNIDVYGIYILTPFNSSGEESAESAADYLRIPLKVIHTGDDYMDVILSPKYGYGKNMNPCIDCKLFMYRKAKEYCEEVGAKFFITGEVVGERPMSQSKTVLLRMEKNAGCGEMVLRPLSAKLLPPTIAEKENVVDRMRLCNISGRSRKPHIELANLLGIELIPTPAGGCLLTDPVFSLRLRESIEHEEVSSRFMELLSVGRHFRLPSGERLVVSRTKEEKEKLCEFATPGHTLFEAGNIVGLLINGKDREQAAAIMARYAHTNRVHYKRGRKKGYVTPGVLNDALLSKYRIE